MVSSLYNCLPSAFHSVLAQCVHSDVSDFTIERRLLRCVTESISTVRPAAYVDFGQFRAAFCPKFSRYKTFYLLQIA